MNRKDFKATGDVVGSTFKATITTDSIDRDGEVVVPQGMNSKNYERNPVLLWNHDTAQPIGKAISLRRGESAIEAEFEFAARPADFNGDWFPDYIRGLVAAKVLRSVSIGFMPLDGGTRQASKADIDRYGPGVNRVFNKWQLLEVSIVSVPANQDALITAVSKGFVTRTAVERFGRAEPMVVPPLAVASRVVDRHRIIVTVPPVGTNEAKRIAREEIAKARGRIVL